MSYDPKSQWRNTYEELLAMLKRMDKPTQMSDNSFDPRKIEAQLNLLLSNIQVAHNTMMKEQALMYETKIEDLKWRGVA